MCGSCRMSEQLLRARVASAQAHALLLQCKDELPEQAGEDLLRHAQTVQQFLQGPEQDTEAASAR